MRNNKYMLKLYISFLLAIISQDAFSSGPVDFTISFGQKLSNPPEGIVSVNLDQSTHSFKISKSFYGADSQGFSPLPASSLVHPLNLGYVKLGGSLHASYNWQLNAYYDNEEIFNVYAPLVNRLNYVQKNYMVEPMFEVNMLGWQPEQTTSGILEYQNTANASHAGNAITYLNSVNKVGIKNITMGNEPFDSEEFNGLHIPSADEYIDKYIAYAMELRLAQEKASGHPNDISLWGPEINTGWTGWQTNHLPDCIDDYDRVEKVKCSYGDGKFSEFIPYFLYRIAAFENDNVKNPKHYKMLNYLTIHYYPLFRKNFSDPNSFIRDPDGYQNVQAMLESVNIWNSETYINKYDYSSPRNIAPNLINKFKNWAKQFYPNVKMGVTEFGIDSVDKIKYHPIVRPLYLADFVARSATAGLDTLINSFLQGGSTSNSWAMIDGTNKTNIYYMYSMFTNYFLGETLTTSDSFGDLVNSYAVKTLEGINIFIINKDNKIHSTRLQSKIELEIKDIAELNLPPWSLTVLTIPENQNEIIRIHQYGAKEMSIDVNSKF